jgi:hypothetical protein
VFRQRKVPNSLELEAAISMATSGVSEHGDKASVA